MAGGKSPGVKTPGLRRMIESALAHPFAFLDDYVAARGAAARAFVTDLDGPHAIFRFDADRKSVADDDADTRGRALLNDSAALRTRLLDDVEVGEARCDEDGGERRSGKHSLHEQSSFARLDVGPMNSHGNLFRVEHRSNRRCVRYWTFVLEESDRACDA